MTERLSGTESVMWAIGRDPLLRSAFTNVTILDRPPDYSRLRARLAGAVAQSPRLRQRVFTSSVPLAQPEWIDDPHFDLDHHLRHVALPPEPDETAEHSYRRLLDLAATLTMTPFDGSRPLWEFTIVEGLADGRAAVLQKVHHVVTDGMGGIQLALALLDLERDPPAPIDADGSATTNHAAADDSIDGERSQDDEGGAPPSNDEGASADNTTGNGATADGPTNQVANIVDNLLASIRELAAMQRTMIRKGVDTATDVLRNPASAPELGAKALNMVRSVREQMFVRGTGLSPIMQGRSLSRRLDTYSVPFSQLHAAAKAADGTINDAFVTGLTGALALYHDRLGAPCDELRMAMPISVRGEGASAGGNHFVPARLVVPLRPADPVERLTAIKSRIGGARDEPALAYAEGFALLAGLVPSSMLIALMKSQAQAVDFAASNVRGAPFEVFSAGARLESNHPMGPLTGTGLNVTVISYCDALDFGINLDPAAVTEPGVLMDCLAESFATLLAIGRPKRSRRRTKASPSDPAR